MANLNILRGGYRQLTFFLRPHSTFSSSLLGSGSKKVYKKFFFLFCSFLILLVEVNMCIRFRSSRRAAYCSLSQPLPMLRPLCQRSEQPTSHKLTILSIKSSYATPQRPTRRQPLRRRASATARRLTGTLKDTCPSLYWPSYRPACCSRVPSPTTY